MRPRTLFLLIVALHIIACSRQEPAPEERSGMSAAATTSDTPSSTLATGGGTIMGLTISSSAFNDGGTIPGKYTCDGENISPPSLLERASGQHAEHRLDRR